MPLEIVNETETETENDATNSKLRLGYRRGLQHQFGCRFEMKNAQKPTRRSKIRKKEDKIQLKPKKHLGSLFLAWVLLFSGVSCFFFDFFISLFAWPVQCDSGSDVDGPVLELHLSAVNIFKGCLAGWEVETNLECPPWRQMSPKYRIEMSLAYYEVSGGLLKSSLRLSKVIQRVTWN